MRPVMKLLLLCMKLICSQQLPGVVSILGLLCLRLCSLVHAMPLQCVVVVAPALSLVCRCHLQMQHGQACGRSTNKRLIVGLCMFLNAASRWQCVLWKVGGAMLQMLSTQAADTLNGHRGVWMWGSTMLMLRGAAHCSTWGWLAQTGIGVAVLNCVTDMCVHVMWTRD